MWAGALRSSISRLDNHYEENPVHNPLAELVGVYVEEA